MDWGTVIVGVLSLIGTIIGSYSGMKLMSYRIEQLEKKVDKHNNLIERMYECEKNIDIHTEHLNTIDHRLDELEKGA